MLKQEYDLGNLGIFGGGPLLLEFENQVKIVLRGFNLGHSDWPVRKLNVFDDRLPLTSLGWSVLRVVEVVNLSGLFGRLRSLLGLGLGPVKDIIGLGISFLVIFEQFQELFFEVVFGFGSLNPALSALFLKLP